MPDRRRLLIALAATVVVAVAIGGLLGDGVSNDPGSSADTNAPTTSALGRTEGRSGTNAQDGSQPRPEPSEVPGTTPGATPRAHLPGLGAAPHATALSTWENPPARSAFARGRMVTGYPTRLLSPAPGGSILSSSVSPSDDRVQVALVAQRAQRGSAVLRFYRSRLSRAGFTETSVVAGGGAGAAAFKRGDDRVVVTVDPGSSRTYSVLATFVVGAA